MAGVLKYAQPDFILHAGDQIADGFDASLWPVFFDIEREVLRKAAFFPALGNHERNAPLWYEIFDQSVSYYSFNWGNSHFSVLNTDIGNVGPGSETRQRYWDDQVKWLREDLERNQAADFRFVVGHHPPMTAVANRQGSNLHIAGLMPMLQQYKVTAGFFGHDHNYQHYLKNGIHYFVTGGGGAPLYDVDKPPEGVTQKVARTENFLVVKVDGKTAQFRAVRPDGETLDQVEIRK
jgi:3',5'-cyclic AMP phosphodiesterase CpdA